MHPQTRILIFLPRDRYLQKIAEGIIEYSLARRNWSLLPVTDEMFSPGDRWLETHNWAGMITSAPGHPLTDRLRERGVPIVGVEHEEDEGQPLVRGDDRLIGQMAFEHLQQLGYTRYSFWSGNMSKRSENLRRESFLQRVEENGHQYCNPFAEVDMSDRQKDDFLRKWLLALPKPIAVFTHYTVAARRLVINAQRVGVAVPEEVAILGLEDDDLLCRANRPTISTIDQGYHRIGQQAAAILDAMMNGKDPPRETMLIPPTHVIQRRTTSFIAIEDALVARAMRYIWHHACEGIQVGEVVTHVNCSRRGLEMRFKKAIGRSIGSEIVRARISYARTLLTETDLSLSEIASACGYPWQAQFTKVFKQMTTETPSAYRKRIAGVAA